MIIFKENKNINDENVRRVEAAVKWYNPCKGYGFLNPEDNSGDIMIHFSALDRVGCPFIKPGDRLICNVVSGILGARVSYVIEIKYGSSDLRSLAHFVETSEIHGDCESLEEIEGTIKWYNPDKGYGFVYPDDGGREIFVSHYVVRAAGYKCLQPGVRVLVKVSNSARGPEAHTIRVLFEAEKDAKQPV